MRITIAVAALVTAGIPSASLMGWAVRPAYPLAQYRTPPAKSAGRGVPAGWTGLFDATGQCRYGVPPFWVIDDRNSRNAFAMSPDGSVVVHQGWVAISSWTDFVQNALRTLQPEHIVTRTGDELRVEHATGESDSQRYIALRAGSGACVGTIDIKTSATPAVLAIADQIENTVSLAK